MKITHVYKVGEYVNIVRIVRLGHGYIRLSLNINAHPWIHSAIILL